MSIITNTLDNLKDITSTTTNSSLINNCVQPYSYQSWFPTTVTETVKWDFQVRKVSNGYIVKAGTNEFVCVSVADLTSVIKELEKGRKNATT